MKWAFFPLPTLSFSLSLGHFFILYYICCQHRQKMLFFLWMSYDVDFNAQGLNVNFFLFLFCFHAVMQTEREKLFFILYACNAWCLFTRAFWFIYKIYIRFFHFYIKFTEWILNVKFELIPWSFLLRIENL